MKASVVLLSALFSAALLSGCNTDSAQNQTAGTESGTDHARHEGHDAPAGGTILSTMNGMMQEMHSIEPKGHVDYDFARMMMDHHRGALEMSSVQLLKGKDPVLRQLAEKIMADQEKEIQEMEQILNRLKDAPANYQPSNPNDPFQQKMQASMDVMMQQMPKESGSVDRDFAAMMIPHHQSAIDMAKAEVAHGQDSRLKEMAQQMIGAQEAEIKQLQGWLAANGR